MRAEKILRGRAAHAELAGESKTETDMPVAKQLLQCTEVSVRRRVVDRDGKQMALEIFANLKLKQPDFWQFFASSFYSPHCLSSSPLTSPLTALLFLLLANIAKAMKLA